MRGKLLVCDFRGFWFRLAVGVGLLVILYWLLALWRNPIHEGQRLRRWLIHLDDRVPVQRVGSGSRIEIWVRRPAELNTGTVNAFQQFGTRAVPLLESRFHREKPAWHVWLGQRGGVLAALAPWLPDVELQRAQALHGLTLLGTNALPAAPRCLKSLSRGHRIWECSHVLSQMGPSVVPGLLDLLQEGHEDEVRAAAVWALSEVRPPALHIVPDLLDALPSAEPQTEVLLIRAIAQLGKPEAKVIQALASRLDHPDPAVVSQARWGLRRHGPLSRQAVPAILDVMQAGGPRRGDLVELLHALDPDMAASFGLR